MSDYFTIYKIAEDTYHIYEPGDVGSSLIVGEEQALLIDTGYGFADIREAVRKITDLPLVVVNTHGHTDHAGGNRFFEQVWINPVDMVSYEDYQLRQKPLVAARFEGTRKAAGKPPIWPEDFDRLAWYAAGTKEFLWLTDGQTFDIGNGHCIETIFIPGHTEGSAVFFDRKSSILFSGDDLGYSEWLCFDASVSLSIYREQMKKLEKYPIQGILPSHQRKLLSPWLLKRMEQAIDHVSPEKSRQFFHPRTGAPGLLYKEHLNGEGPDGMNTIFITYQRNKM